MIARKLEMTWLELEEHLQKREILMRDEQIKEITLVHPKEVIIYTVKK